MEWIKIEDKLPEKGFGWYLVFSQNVIFKAWYNKDSIGKWYHEGVYWQPTNIVVRKPTHWMPLPEKPASSTKQKGA